MSWMKKDTNPLESCLLDAIVHEDKDLEILQMANFFNSQVPYRRGNHYESLQRGKWLPLPSSEQAPSPELKPLFKHLSDAFLGENNILLVIISAFLDDMQLEKVL